MTSLLLALLLLTSPQSAEPLGLRLIMVRTDADATNILARLEAGEKFEELATKLSIDSTAAAGGYLGTFAINQLRSEFRNALEGLKPGQTSGIIRLGREVGLLHVLTSDETHAMEVKAWTDRGADPKSPAIERLWTIAISAENSSLIKKLVDAHADVNATLGDGSTVLMGATKNGHLESVTALLAAGASPNAQTADGTTALLVAAQTGNAEIVRALLKAGATVNGRKKNGGTALIDAASDGHVDAVRALLEGGADANLMQDGSTALMAASRKGHTEVVQALLGGRANVNAGFDTGRTALMEAADAGRAGTVRTLLAAGADPKFSDPSGLTALMQAALGGHTEAVQALLDAGAATAPRDKRGWNALTYARSSANSATVRAVLAKTSDITPQERSIALGGTYLNEYYSSKDSNLLEMAAAEFQKVLSAQPFNAEALEWMGAVEFLRWGNTPSLEQFKKTDELLRKSAELDTKDPDRHYWIEATSSIFLANATGTSVLDTARILAQAIQHGKRAIELDPQFADAMDHLSVLYRREAQILVSEREPLQKLADASQQDAVKARERLRNRPPRSTDQFSRPALPPPPKLN